MKKLKIGIIGVGRLGYEHCLQHCKPRSGFGAGSYRRRKLRPRKAGR